MTYDLQQAAARFKAAPTPEHQRAVVEAARPLIHSILGRIRIPKHPLAAREDLESVGVLGLLEALTHYETDRGTPFVSYAYGRTRGAIVDYLRSIDVLSRDDRRNLAEARRTEEELGQRLGRAPSSQEVAGILGIRPQAYRHLINEAVVRHATSVHDHQDGIVDPDGLHAFRLLDEASLMDRVTVVIRTLPEREQTILALYYFEDLKLREIGQILGLTEARISQILSALLRKLRERVSGDSRVAA